MSESEFLSRQSSRNGCVFFAGFPTVVVVVVLYIVVVIVWSFPLGQDACASVDERQTRFCLTDVIKLMKRKIR